MFSSSVSPFVASHLVCMHREEGGGQFRVTICDRRKLVRDSVVPMYAIKYIPIFFTSLQYIITGFYFRHGNGRQKSLYIDLFGVYETTIVEL